MGLLEGSDPPARRARRKIFAYRLAYHRRKLDSGLEALSIYRAEEAELHTVRQLDLAGDRLFTGGRV